MSQISDLTSFAFSSPEIQKSDYKRKGIDSKNDGEVSYDDMKKKVKLNLTDDDDSDDDSSYSHDKDMEDNSDDDLEYDLSDSEGRFPTAHIDLRPPKLSKAEKKRSKLKSSSVRGNDRKQKISSVDSAMSSRGASLSYEKRIHELSSSKFKIQDSKTNFPFVKGSHDENKRGFMKCLPCGCEVTFKVLSTIQDHVNSKKHINNTQSYIKNVLPLQMKMKTFIENQRKEDHNLDKGHKKSLSTQELRMKLCYALLSDGLPFKFLDNKNTVGLSSLLRTDAGIDVSSRVIRDMIPDVNAMEDNMTTDELIHVKYLSVIFDATPDRGEAFGVVVRYVNDLFEIHHRCIELIFYDTVFDQETLGKSSI